MLYLILIPFLVGFISYLTPTGPITISIFKNAMLGKYGKVLMIIFGTSLVQFFYCSLSLILISEIISPKVVFISRLLSSLVFFVLGIHLLLSKPRKSSDIIRLKDLPNKEKLKSFLIGFLLTLLNPAIIFSWLAVITLFISFDFIVISNLYSILFFALSAVAGIVIGSGLMMFLVHYYKELFSEKHIRMLLKFLGIMVISLSFYFLYSALFL